MAWLGQSFPCLTDSPRKFLGVHARGNSGYQACSLQGGCGVNHRVEWIDSGYGQQLYRLPFLFGHGNDSRKQLSFVIREQLLFTQSIFAGAGR